MGLVGDEEDEETEHAKVESDFRDCSIFDVIFSFSGICQDGDGLRQL